MPGAEHRLSAPYWVTIVAARLALISAALRPHRCLMLLAAESMVGFLLTGYIGITLAIALTGCGLPIPEELPIVTAGALSRVPDKLDWTIALPCAIFGALAGDS